MMTIIIIKLYSMESICNTIGISLKSLRKEWVLFENENLSKTYSKILFITNRMKINYAECHNCQTIKG